MSEKFVKVGKVKDAHGIRGELFLVFFGGEADWIDELDSIRLVNDLGEPDPKNFAIKSVRPHKNGMILKSADIKDRNMAETLKGRVIEIPEELLISEKGESIYLREILGFVVHTKAQGAVGPVTGFSSNVVQDLLVVKAKNGVFEIPFVKDFVETIDYDAKTIHMILPVGLLGEEIGPEYAAQDGANDALNEKKHLEDSGVSADATEDSTEGSNDNASANSASVEDEQ